MTYDMGKQFKRREMHWAENTKLSYSKAFMWDYNYSEAKR